MDDEILHELVWVKLVERWALGEFLLDDLPGVLVGDPVTSGQDQQAECPLPKRERPRAL